MTLQNTVCDGELELHSSEGWRAAEQFAWCHAPFSQRFERGHPPSWVEKKNACPHTSGRSALRGHVGGWTQKTHFLGNIGTLH